MWLDAILAYLHYVAIFILFAFMSVQLVLIKQRLDAPLVKRMGRIDIALFIAAMVVLVTGFLRATLGAKGPDFYFGSWPIYVKLALFLAIAVISIIPTLRFIHWKRMFEKDAAFTVPADEQAKVRRLMMVEVHLAAVIPLVAVIMARGLAH